MIYQMIVRLLFRLGFDVRGIFRYYDGRRWRYADPMVIARKLWNFNHYHVSDPAFPGELVPFESYRCQELIKTGIGIKMQQGYAEAAEAAREAFGVKTLADGGLTDLECMTLIERFESYLGDLKKNGNTFPISPDSTDSTGRSATNAESDSGSTLDEPNYELPDVSGLV